MIIPWPWIQSPAMPYLSPLLRRLTAKCTTVQGWGTKHIVREFHIPVSLRHYKCIFEFLGASKSKWSAKYRNKYWIFMIILLLSDNAWGGVPYFALISAPASIFRDTTSIYIVGYIAPQKCYVIGGLHPIKTLTWASGFECLQRSVALHAGINPCCISARWECWAPCQIASCQQK